MKRLASRYYYNIFENSRSKAEQDSCRSCSLQVSLIGFRLRYSIFPVALAFSTGLVIVAPVSLHSVRAEEITYSGNKADLKQDPVSNNVSHLSLFPQLNSSSDNVITVTNGVGGGAYATPHAVYGGYNDSNDVTGNIVNIEGGSMGGVYGGYSKTGNVIGNTVNISGGSILNGPLLLGGYRIIHGGYSGSGNVTGNTVNITGGTFANANGKAPVRAYGGFSDSGAVTNNTMRFEGGKISGSIHGGYSNTGDVTDNKTIITGGTVDIASGGAVSTSGLVANNIVTVSDGMVNSVFGGDSTGKSQVIDNTVNITGGIISGYVYGGQSFNGEVLGNAINVSGGSIAKSVYGGNSFDEDAYNNTVVITGGSISGTVYGGNTFSMTAYNNTVVVTGGTIAGSIYGGSSNFGEAVNNTVTLAGEKVSILGEVYGGWSDDNPVADVFTGNTLNLEQYRGSVQGIYNFERYTYTLPADVKNGDVMVTITGNDAVDLTGTMQDVKMVQTGNRLNAGDMVTLIDKAQGYGSHSALITQGFFITYDATISDTKDGKLVLKINEEESEEIPLPPTDLEPVNPINPGSTDQGSINPVLPPSKPDLPAAYINPRSKAFAEGRVAALAFVNQGNDLIAGTAFQVSRSIMGAGQLSRNYNLTPFMTVSGGSSRYDSGSNVDVDGINGIVGVAGSYESVRGHFFTLGAFYEYGRGTYGSYNSFMSHASVHGSGNSNYSGGGLLFRAEFAGTGINKAVKLNQNNVDGFYLEASLRAGQASMDFDSADLTDAEGNRGRYDFKTPYYGAHGTVGYVFNFNEKRALDIYGRYMWTHMNGDTVRIGRDKLRFESTDSHRIRLGARYNYSYNDMIKPYIGAAYEHEFKADIAARAYEFSLDRPSLQGETGIFELGISLKPIADKPALSLDLAGEGFVGMRQGGSGTFKIKYDF